jgi:hypothetical protein
MTSPTVCASTVHTLLDESHTDEVGDGSIILSPDQAQRIGQFRNQIHLSKTDRDSYEICVRTRNEPLNEHTGGQLLVAACEHVMFTQCTRHKDWKEAVGKSTIKETRSDRNDTAEWGGFLTVAKEGDDIESKCHVALKTVALHGTAGLRGRSSVCKRALCLDLLQPPGLTD